MGTNKDYFSELDPAYQGQGLKFGIVMSRFNRDICEGLLSACEAELLRLGVAREDVLLVNVPGALEHPLALQELALSEKYDALIALGAVVRGDTYHFEVVSNESARGILHYADLFRLADQSGLFVDPELAAGRMTQLCALNGVA